MTMGLSVEQDGCILVGGDVTRRLTPSFRLKEFVKPDGSIRVHRELVAGIQLLRNRFGRPVSVKRTDADGLGAVVSGQPAAELVEVAGRVARKVFAEVSGEQD